MKKSAFSLIELSIVILIIGILIAGVTQSSRLVAKMRLASARAATQSSDAASVKNMLFWLETTSEKSFDDAATEDTTSINTTTTNYSWYDINNQLSQKSNAATATLGADYKLSGINGLPVLNFDGTTEFMDITQTNGVASQLSVFIVFRPLALPGSSAYGALLTTKGTTFVLANSPVHLNINNNVAEYAYFNSGTSAAAAIVTGPLSANNAYVLDVIDDGTALQTISISGASGMTRTASGAVASSAKNLNGGLTIGAWNNGTTTARWFNGDIGEIIMFDRALKAEERNAIEKYLGKKWGIKSY